MKIMEHRDCGIEMTSAETDLGRRYLLVRFRVGRLFFELDWKDFTYAAEKVAKEHGVTL